MRSTRPVLTHFRILRANQTHLNPKIGPKIGLNPKKRVGFGCTTCQQRAASYILLIFCRCQALVIIAQPCRLKEFSVLFLSCYFHSLKIHKLIFSQLTSIIEQCIIFSQLSKKKIFCIFKKGLIQTFFSFHSLFWRHGVLFCRRKKL